LSYFLQRKRTISSILRKGNYLIEKKLAGKKSSQLLWILIWFTCDQWNEDDGFFSNRHMNSVIILLTLRLSIVMTNDSFFCLKNSNKWGLMHECFYHGFFNYTDIACLDTTRIASKLVYHFHSSGNA
jgi:hypothetical protein